MRCPITLVTGLLNTRCRETLLHTLLAMKVSGISPQSSGETGVAIVVTMDDFRRPRVFWRYRPARCYSRQMSKRRLL
jgi:hypothetical protein